MKRIIYVFITILLFSVNIHAANNNTQFFSLNMILDNFNLDYEFVPESNQIILKNKNHGLLKIDLRLQIAYSEFKVYKSPREIIYISGDNIYIHNHLLYRFFNTFFIPSKNIDFFNNWYKNYNKNSPQESVNDDNDNNTDSDGEIETDDEIPDDGELIYETTGDEDNYYNQAVEEITEYRRLSFIVIDAGHGGKDPGATAGSTYEKNINLNFSKYLLNAMRNKFKDIQILLSREDDTFISLENRVVFSNSRNTSKNTGLFISIHANSSPFSTKASGFEIYFLDYNLADEKIKDLVKKENLDTEDNEINLYINRLLNEELIYESELLAKYIFEYYSSYEKSIKAKKVLGAPFYVLAYNQVPSILIEMGYMSNKNDLKNMQSEQYKSNLALSIIKGIERFINEYENTKGFKEF